MLKLILSILSILFVIAPATALAHPGHPHVGGEASHHLLEYAVIAGGTALVLWFATYLYSRRASRDDG